jgi:serine/threonine protein kinase
VGIRTGAYQPIGNPYRLGAWLSILAGSWEEAEELAREGILAFGGQYTATTEWFEGELRVCYGVLCILRGEFRQARRHLEAAIVKSEPHAPLNIEAPLAAAFLALVEAECGQPEEAKARITFAREQAERMALATSRGTIDLIDRYLHPELPSAEPSPRPFLEEQIARLVIRELVKRRPDKRVEPGMITPTLDASHSFSSPHRVEIGDYDPGFSPGAVVCQRYQVQRLLGRGGMGAVYLCQDEVLQEPVALKVIAPTRDREQMERRFRLEVSAARRIVSNQVVRIYDLGESESGRIFISMEYVPGTNLAEQLENGPLPRDELEAVLEQICSGLTAAHAAGVIHRDLKPANVLLGAGNTVKIIDFGLARTLSLAGVGPKQAATTTGQMLGTPAYMAPEQIRGESVDERCDIYSLGALAYHLVTGRPPFKRGSAVAVAFAQLTDTPVAPRNFNRDTPQALNDAILAALAKDPDERPRTVAEFHHRAINVGWS